MDYHQVEINFILDTSHVINLLSDKPYTFVFRHFERNEELTNKEIESLIYKHLMCRGLTGVYRELAPETNNDPLYQYIVDQVTKWKERKEAEPPSV